MDGFHVCLNLRLPKMRAAKKNIKKINSEQLTEQLTAVLNRIDELNISLRDIDGAIELFEKLSKILVQLNFSLPPLSLIDNVTQGSNVNKLHNQLHKLRIASIALLNCKKIISFEKVNQQKASKRPYPCRSNISMAKRRNIVNTDAKLINEQCNFTPISDFLDHCYVCKQGLPPDISRHEFYPWMCSECGVKNYKKRYQISELDGKVALVTGGRIKIGFEIVLKLLRCGASVIMTTRFPRDAQRRFEVQEDFAMWENRLHIYKMDLRFTQQVERFCAFILANFKRLDILIQNAAQTIRRPSAYYKSLVDGESKAVPISSCNETGIQSRSLQILSPLELDVCKETAQLLVHPDDVRYANDPILTQLHFPFGLTDLDGDQLDLRPKNTWITALDEVDTEEMFEVTLANYMSPYILLQKLTPLMKQEGSREGNSK